MNEQVSELETAILERAQRLANEYRERAKRSRDNILREAHEKLRIKEEREVLLAKARAERAYRRKVQANELKFQKEMDHLRWNLLEEVLLQLADRMQALSDDQERYLAVLSTLLAEAASALPEQPLVAELNTRDLQRLKPLWEQFCANATDGREIRLSHTPIETLGGVLLRSEDNRLRMNNTFEGRQERLSPQLNQIILQRLLPDRRAQNVIKSEA
ncbi:MAG: hypothetical protein B0D87_06275 [Candidatus Sedimenticola endophacoides]|nr:MAG: hypothetical protein B0D87_06275 [Candidatus Sedimenticola endophacoides]